MVNPPYIPLYHHFHGEIALKLLGYICSVPIFQLYPIVLMIKTTISMVNSPLNNKPSVIFCSFSMGPNDACATGPGTQSTCSISCVFQ